MPLLKQMDGPAAEPNPTAASSDSDACTPCKKRKMPSSSKSSARGCIGLDRIGVETRGLLFFLGDGWRSNWMDKGKGRTVLVNHNLWFC